MTPTIKTKRLADGSIAAWYTVGKVIYLEIVPDDGFVGFWK